jgi:hypothetical protein
MARLIYSVIASLDGYVADQQGNFDWAEPDVGGPGLAGQALSPGLVDECQLFLTPIVIGGGKS